MLRCHHAGELSRKLAVKVGRRQDVEDLHFFGSEQWRPTSCTRLPARLLPCAAAARRFPCARSQGHERMLIEKVLRIVDEFERLDQSVY